jgi:hypothetical protein
MGRADSSGNYHSVLLPGNALVTQTCKNSVPKICDVDASHDWFTSVWEALHWSQLSIQGGAACPGKSRCRCLLQTA